MMPQAVGTWSTVENAIMRVCLRLFDSTDPSGMPKWDLLHEVADPKKRKPSGVFGDL